VLFGFLMFAVFCDAQAISPPSPEKIIIDTDIGDDVDDAFAVALALRSPELEILGITATFGDTETRESSWIDCWARPDARTFLSPRELQPRQPVCSHNVATPRADILRDLPIPRRWILFLLRFAVIPARLRWSQLAL